MPPPYQLGMPWQDGDQRHVRTRTIVKVLVMVCGVLLVLVGLFFMVAPGPGLPIVATQRSEIS